MNNILEAGKDYSWAEIETFCTQAFAGQFSSRFLRTVGRGASLYEVTHHPTGRTFDFIMGSAYNRGPNEVEIMYGPCMDYQAGEMEYQEFLANFGYEDNSDARKVYHSCQVSGGIYRAILNCDENGLISVCSLK